MNGPVIVFRRLCGLAESGDAKESIRKGVAF